MLAMYSYLQSIAGSANAEFTCTYIFINMYTN